VVPLIKRQDAIINEKIRLLAFSFSPFLVSLFSLLSKDINQRTQQAVCKTWF
jgi:hypothetical protein